jgi:osmotically-inducible protein OsmY
VQPNSGYLQKVSLESEQATAIGASSEGGYHPEGDAAQETTTQVDQALQRDVQQQLGSASSFQNVEIHVSNGVVTLEGPVSSQDARKRAVDLVRVLPGVKGVNEHLTVDAQAVGAATATADTGSNAELNPLTSEAALASQIAVAMHDDPTLANRQVKVTVKGDLIELTGTVASKEERNKAKEIAQSFAIHQRIVNKLTIVPRDNSKE